MDNLSRCKGRRGEQELARLLSDELGSTVTRNLMQTREGGHDLLGLDGWSVECKRAAQPRLNEWWTQAVEQATATRSKPVLAYRLDRQQWRFVVALRDLLPSLKSIAALNHRDGHQRVCPAGAGANRLLTWGQQRW